MTSGRSRDTRGRAGTDAGSTDSGTLITRAATELFAELGFTQVTIRAIAARAGVSPAMVMKRGGSKLELYYRVATVLPLVVPDSPDELLGEALVRDLIDREEAASRDPLVRAIVLKLAQPPDPELLRQQVVDNIVRPLETRLGGGPDARLRALLAVSALVGLASTLRILDLSLHASDREAVRERYGLIVQKLIDG